MERERRESEREREAIFIPHTVAENHTSRTDRNDRIKSITNDEVPNKQDQVRMAMMALPIPVLGFLARVILVSFPNLPDGAALGVFQAAPSYAVGFHFRPLTDFGARFLFFRPADGALRLGPALLVMKRRCVVSNDPGAGQKSIRKKYGKMTEKFPEDSTWALVRAGALPWLSAFSASWCIPSANGSPDSASREIRADFCRMESEGLCCPLAWWGEPNGGNRWWEMTTGRVAGHFEPVGEDAGLVTVYWKVLSSVAAEFASPQCSAVVEWWTAVV